MKLWQKNLILIVLVVVLAAIPLVVCRDAEFGGADGEAESLVFELQPDYEPIFSPFWSLPAGKLSPCSSPSRPPSAPG